MAHVRSLFFGGPLSEIGQRTLAAFQERRPSEIIWNVTNRCNLFCKHCYVAADALPATGELSTDEALALVDQIGESKVPLLFLTGGEPLLRKDFFQILERASSYPMKIVVSTHGQLVTEDVADALRRYGVDYVAISLYGPREFHDRYVGVPGSFDRVMENIARLRKRGIKVGIKTTLTRATFPHFFETVEVAKTIGAGLVYACDLISSGRAVPLKEERITKAQWMEIADFVVRDVLATPEGGLEYDIGALPSLSVVLKNAFEAHGVDTAKASARMRIKSACPVGKGLMGINSEGAVLPCSFVQDYTVGNVRDLGVRTAIEKLFELGSAPVTGKCASCGYTDLCRGCRVKAFHDCGDVLGEDRTCLVTS